MELKQIAQKINEKLQSVDSYYIGSDNIWGLALAFAVDVEDNASYQALVDHPQYGDGDALLAVYDEVYEEWYAMMEEHDMWPVANAPEDFYFEHPSKVH